MIKCPLALNDDIERRSSSSPRSRAQFLTADRPIKRNQQKLRLEISAAKVRLTALSQKCKKNNYVVICY